MGKIITIFGESTDHPGNIFYNESIRSALQRMFPLSSFFDEVNRDDEKAQFFSQTLPLVKWSEWGTDLQKRISIFLLCRYRPNASKFFYDIISRWLLPGKRLKIGLFFSTDFKLITEQEDLYEHCISNEEDVYTLSEMVLCIEELEHLELLRRNLSLIEPELKLGVSSVYHAHRIMEIKGLATDEKMSLVQERIASLVQRRPKDFDYDIFNQMQHFLVRCREEFKGLREHHHMSRLISFFYLFRKDLRQKVEAAPRKRHLSLKLLQARLHHALGIKRVLALIVGINFLKENELFEQRHLVRALQNHIPKLRAIEDSFMIDEDKEDRIQIIYLEVEKEDNSEITAQEIKRLRKILPEDLKRKVEQLMRPIFMPRNEEEVMRYIVSLTSQLKYVRDFPQVVISFDEQTDTDLFFTMIVARILLPHILSLQKLFQQNVSRLSFILDRVRRVGMLRNKYPKEVAVFRVRLPNTAFLREDHSLDLYKARQEVILELENILGEVRDFNGGMIAKQVEVFLALKEELGDIGKSHEFLLENFFHSIFPVECRSVLAPDPLKILFLMLLSLIDQEKTNKERILFEFSQNGEGAYALLALSEPTIKQKIFEIVDLLHIPTSQLVCVHLQLFDIIYLGYAYFSDDVTKREAFINALKDANSTL